MNFILFIGLIGIGLSLFKLFVLIFACIADFYIWIKPRVPMHQSPIQTKYGKLYYETPYRGESTCESCDGSCGCTHGKELE